MINKNIFYSLIIFFLVGAAQYLNIVISKYTGIFPIISISGGIICWLFFKRGFKLTIISSAAGIIFANYLFGHNYLYINVFYSSNNILAPSLIYLLLNNNYKKNKIINSSKSIILFFAVSAFSAFIFIVPESLYLYNILNISMADITTISLGSFLSVFTGISFFTPFLLVIKKKIKKEDLSKLPEYMIIYLICISVSFLIFFNFFNNFTNDILVFMFIPMIIITAFRASPPVLSVLIISVGIIAVNSTLLNKSSFSAYSHYQSMILIQFFFILSYITVVLMKSLIYEKDLAIKKINELNLNLESKVKKRTQKLNNALIKLKNTKKVYKNIFDNAGDGIFRVNSSGKILNLNNAAAKIFGYSSIDEVKFLIENNGLKIFYNSKKKDEFIHLIGNSDKPERFEFEAITKDKNLIWVQIIASKEDIKDSGFIIEGIIRDISKEKAFSEKLIEKAFLDPLTKVYNREALYEKIDLNIKNIEKFSIFFMDMDGFKEVNDTLGHDAGDKILKIITKRILKSIRESDIVARFGGDEFILLINKMEDIEDIKSFSLKIIEKLSSPYRVEQGINSLGVSIGVSRFPKDSTSRNELISKADQAMYTSKKNGKNRWTLYKRENYETT